MSIILRRSLFDAAIMKKKPNAFYRSYWRVGISQVNFLLLCGVISTTSCIKVTLIGHRGILNFTGDSQAKIGCTRRNQGPQKRCTKGARCHHFLSYFWKRASHQSEAKSIAKVSPGVEGW